MRPLVTLSHVRVGARGAGGNGAGCGGKGGGERATFAPRGITPQDTVVFVIGMIPFVWATIEFWRRIAVGEPFGTGKDSVIIRDTSGPGTLQERRRVLGRDAIITACLLFVAVGLTLGLVALAGYQALNSGSVPLSG
jgi:hypothetical protein